MARNFYEHWNEEDHKRGYRVFFEIVGELEKVDGGVIRHEVLVVKYQPKGFSMDNMRFEIVRVDEFKEGEKIKLSEIRSYEMSSVCVDNEVSVEDRFRNYQASMSDMEWSRHKYSRKLNRSVFKSYEELRLEHLEEKSKSA